MYIKKSDREDNNSSFQGTCNSPVLKPRKVEGLEAVPIHQISAGTSHSIAWTAIPTDRKVRVTPTYTLHRTLLYHVVLLHGFYIPHFSAIVYTNYCLFYVFIKNHVNIIQNKTVV